MPLALIDPADWRLFLPQRWDPVSTATVDDAQLAAEVTERRKRCRIPAETSHEEKWRLALDMLGQMTSR